MSEKFIQIEKNSIVNKSAVLFLFQNFTQEKFSLFYDLTIKAIKDFYYRPFYYEDDKLLLLNALSNFQLNPLEDNLVKVDKKIFENPNWQRLILMLQLAERDNLSVFSVAHYWLVSSHLHRKDHKIIHLNINGEDIEINVNKEQDCVLKELLTESLENYEDAEEDINLTS